MLCLFGVLPLYDYAMTCMRRVFLLPCFCGPFLQCVYLELTFFYLNEYKQQQKCNNMGSITKGKVDKVILEN
jgi:hypothetical protein